MPEYDIDPAKARVRHHFRSFLEETVLKDVAPEDARVVHLPGWANMEWKQVYVPLGFRPENVVGLEMDAETAVQLQREVPFKIVPASTTAFFADVHAPFDVVSLDFTGYANRERFHDVRCAALSKEVESSVLHLTFQKGRERKEVQEDLYIGKIASNLSDARKFGIAPADEDDLSPDLKVDRVDALYQMVNSFYSSNDADGWWSTAQRFFDGRALEWFDRAGNGLFGDDAPMLTSEDDLSYLPTELVGLVYQHAQVDYVEACLGGLLKEMHADEQSFQKGVSYLANALLYIASGRSLTGQSIDRIDSYQYQSTTVPMHGIMAYGTLFEPRARYDRLAKFIKFGGCLRVTNERSFRKAYTQYLETVHEELIRNLNRRETSEIIFPSDPLTDTEREETGLPRPATKDAIYGAIRSGADSLELVEEFGLTKGSARAYLASFTRMKTAS